VSSSRRLLGSSGTRPATAMSRANSPWLDRSRVHRLDTGLLICGPVDQRPSRRSVQCAVCKRRTTHTSAPSPD
jgi:hypothetical protein